MEVWKILKDSVKYPFSDWKKLLILGVIIVFSGISSVAVLGGTRNVEVIYFLVIIGIMVGFLVNGYLFRIVESSLVGIFELPKFNDWGDLFLDGIKLDIIGIFYAIPVILVILVFTALSFIPILGSTGTTQFLINSIISNAGIECLRALGHGIWATVVTLYVVIIYPIFLLAIANMANNDGKLSAAFSFQEILKKITRIGWGNLVEWYILIEIIYSSIAVIGALILNIFTFHTPLIGAVIFSLTISPYLSMYIYRALALLYIS